MNEVIIVKPEKCVGCNACVRVCPAPEANITKMVENGKFVTAVNPDRCISCGECVKTCTHGARDYIDDTNECMTKIEQEKVIILVAPAIKSAFPKQWTNILDWFRSKGCLIYDVSMGADICTWAHIRAMDSNKFGNMISQPCAAIVNYIETYQPKLLQNLSPIHSPISCAAIYIRKYLRRNNPIAVLSPCIAKKTEFAQTGTVQYNVTFKKLMEYFDRNDIKIPSSPKEEFTYKFDEGQGQLGAIYPRPGGLKDNILLHNTDVNVSTSEGVHKVFPELDMYAQMPDNKHPQLFDVLSCEFGCNTGPGMANTRNIFDIMNTMAEVEKEARSRQKISGGRFIRGTTDALFKKYDEELELSDFIRNYQPKRPSPVPTEMQLEPIYESMGKHTEADRHYDCHACGYHSCRDMAIAIFRGLNTPDNCIVHAKSVLVAKHSELISKHEKLAQITSECLELSDKLKNDLENITSNMNTIDESTTKSSERADVVNNLLKNVVTFCNNNPTMDDNCVKQLTKILETTIDAFGVLDENLSVTNDSSAVISNSINEISRLVDEINKTLYESEES